MKNIKLLFCLIACVCFVTCKNPIMETWWVEKEPEYIPITKMVPQVTYQTVIEHEFVYRDIFVQLPPEVIYETIVQQETVTKEVPVYIYETIIQKVPEIIYETIKEPVYITIYQPVIEKVPEYIYETVIEKIYEYHYETIIEIEEKTVYETVYETIHDIVYETVHDTVTITRDPTEDEIKDYIKNHETEIIQIIKDDPDFEELIKEYIKENPAEVIEIIKTVDNWKEILKEIIKDIPPEDLITYLTEDQIKYIIQQQPPQVILQTINIIDIEYIIFAGNADQYNGPPGTGGSTPLTAQEKDSNDKSISAMAQALNDHPNYLIMLHGHANPTTFTDAEIGDLKKLSEDRANAVDAVLMAKFKALNGVDIEDSRVSVSGYGGEKVLFSSNSTYTALNRRVEMILISIDTQNG